MPGCYSMKILCCPSKASQRRIHPILKCIICRPVFVLIRETNEFPNNHIMMYYTPLQNQMMFVLVQLPGGRRKELLPVSLHPSLPLSHFSSLLLPQQPPLLSSSHSSLSLLLLLEFFIFLKKANLVSGPALGTADPPVAWEALSRNVFFCHRSAE